MAATEGRSVPVPSVPVPIRTDTSPAGLRASIHDDLVASALRRRGIDGERVVRANGFVAYLSTIASADVNMVGEARFTEADADRRIADVIDLFAGRPFLWWLGDDDMPADLGARLNRRAVHFLDDLPGMAMDLAELATGDSAATTPAGLVVRPVLDADAMAAFHAVIAQGFPEDVAYHSVEEAIGAASWRAAEETDHREPGGLPTRWVGYADGVAVTTTRLHTAAGVAGIYAVVTALAARRRGYGEAITRHVLRAARDGGLRIATLQASSAGRGIYERIGFRELRRYRLHEWQPGHDA